jgi:hypothetical protein
MDVDRHERRLTPVSDARDRAGIGASGAATNKTKGSSTAPDDFAGAPLPI